ncbi:MAG TPA: ATP-binding protein [Gaiellaceae bacterium]
MSLRLRILAAFAYGFLLILVALEVPLALNLKRRVDAEVRSDAAGQAHIVAAQASGSMNRPVRLRTLTERAASTLGARVIVVDSTGALKADSSGGAQTSYASRPEIRVALSGRTAQGERHSDTLGTDLLYTAVPVTSGGQTVGAVRVTQSVSAVTDRVRRSVLALIAIGAAALLLGLVLAWFLADSLSRPLRKLAKTARQFEEGDLDGRAEVTGPQESREVAVAFNDMAERIGTVLAAQQEFVANASHQLRTPLTGLRLRLESAAAKADSQELERELAAAEQEVERLARLLNTLLMLAREGQTPRAGRLVSLGLAAKHAHERWEDRAEQRGQRLELEPAQDVVVHAAEEDLAIVLDNLVENALHYSPTGSTVTIEHGRDGADAFLAVLDDGPGIAPGEEQAVFERFGRGRAGKSGPSGTGLGLAIVQTLAERWGGRAALTARPEGGTRAEIRLPAGDALPAEEPEATEAIGAPT